MLTKENILKNIKEEELIKQIIPEFVGSSSTKNYKSCFSEKDDKPSLSFFQKNNQWFFKSHNTGHGGDVFSLWQQYYNISFKEVLEKINLDFHLNLQNKNHKEFSIEYIDFSPLFLDYWNSFGVSIKILNLYNVKQVKFISFVSGKRVLNFNYYLQGKFVAAYNIGGRIKTYIPSIPIHFNGDTTFQGQKKAFGFKNQTKEDVFGLEQLPEKVDYILLTAGEKDCLVANAYGFSSISFQSENTLPSNFDSFLKILHQKTKNIICCYDADEAGNNAANRLNKKYGIPIVRLPNDTKDIAEYFQKYTKTDFAVLVDKALNEVNPDFIVVEEKKKFDNKNKETSLTKIEEYLNAKYQFRFDTIGLNIECCLVKKKKYMETG